MYSSFRIETTRCTLAILLLHLANWLFFDYCILCKKIGYYKENTWLQLVAFVGYTCLTRNESSWYRSTRCTTSPPQSFTSVYRDYWVSMSTRPQWNIYEAYAVAITFRRWYKCLGSISQSTVRKMLFFHCIDLFFRHKNGICNPREWEKVYRHTYVLDRLLFRQ